MDKTKFLKMLDAYESDCENGKVKAYKDGEVNSHIHWRGRLSAAKEFRQMMLEGVFDIETTASPSVAAADKGHLLTEEELNHLSKAANALNGLKITNVMKLINSHRNLLSANAELSFKNKKLTEALTDISTHVGDYLSREFYYDAYLEVKKIAYKASEELK